MTRGPPSLWERSAMSPPRNGPATPAIITADASTVPIRAGLTPKSRDRTGAVQVSAAPSETCIAAAALSRGTTTRFNASDHDPRGPESLEVTLLLGGSRTPNSAKAAGIKGAVSAMATYQPAQANTSSTCFNARRDSCAARPQLCRPDNSLCPKAMRP